MTLAGGQVAQDLSITQPTMEATRPSAAAEPALGPLPDHMPEKLGKYTLSGELGRGAMFIGRA